MARTISDRDQKLLQTLLLELWQLFQASRPGIDALCRHSKAHRHHKNSSVGERMQINMATLERKGFQMYKNMVCSKEISSNNCY